MQTAFAKKIIAMRGEAGRSWLTQLPEIVKTYEKKWGIRVGDPFTLSYNYVAPAQTNDGQPVVLKISFPNNHEFAPEVAALSLFPKDASVQVVAEDAHSGVVLLEQAVPGTRLRDYTTEDEQITIASQVIKSLHRPITGKDALQFPTIGKWAKAFDRYKAKYTQAKGPVSKPLLDAGEGILREYLQEKKPQVLLHGDLHSDNILLSERGWLVIDPKGVIGESEFELGAYLRNPLYDLSKGTDYKAVERRRIQQLAQELGFEKERIRNWAFACAVLSLLWLLEDEGKRAEAYKEMYVRSAEILKELTV